MLKEKIEAGGIYVLWAGWDAWNAATESLFWAPRKGITWPT